MKKLAKKSGFCICRVSLAENGLPVKIEAEFDIELPIYVKYVVKL